MIQMHRVMYSSIQRGGPETARRATLDHLQMIGMDLLATPRRVVE